MAQATLPTEGEEGFSDSLSCCVTSGKRLPSLSLCLRKQMRPRKPGPGVLGVSCCVPSAFCFTYLSGWPHGCLLPRTDLDCDPPMPPPA